MHGLVDQLHQNKSYLQNVSVCGHALAKLQLARYYAAVDT